MAREIKLTKAGYERLKAQLEQEYQRLAEATRILQEQMESFEDYEDSGLEDAKREKARIEARIDSLEDTLSRAVILEDSQGGQVVALGSRLVLQDAESGEGYEIQIVAPAEASVLEEPLKISDESPVGSALLGRREGESVRVETPRGIREYRIISVG
ncbi:GreA/GreB family elongation factor [Marinithermus hydrothermalis]|uniref:GreA/GreB family elongation factor n=1 Tax=Marinithermus hydrothermalis (strain DSM 14884 / JCM 11576 / T1) TaxID=869210 RepID=F2NP48_MARHT|nr:GreA/GreB family elongation factor [Marinithermus hydrothermalis]AEB11849.1 GreA/GreB family elongation factor [Marinithermus hydrothermalis DSM 14884]